jgi:hypothetical protein
VGKRARDKINFAGFTRRSATADFTQKLKNDSWCGLEAVEEVTERPGQLGLKCRAFRALLLATHYKRVEQFAWSF